MSLNMRHVFRMDARTDKLERYGCPLVKLENTVELF